jgi:hypothetical protein
MFDILGVKYLTNNLQEIYYNINFLGTNAYQDLVKIIRHPEFKADQVPYSVTTIKKIRNGLPLLPITENLFQLI